MLCIYILAVTRSQLRAANVSCSSFVSRSAAAIFYKAAWLDELVTSWRIKGFDSKQKMCK